MIDEARRTEPVPAMTDDEFLAACAQAEAEGYPTDFREARNITGGTPKERPWQTTP